MLLLFRNPTKMSVSPYFCFKPVNLVNLITRIGILYPTTDGAGQVNPSCDNVTIETDETIIMMMMIPPPTRPPYMLHQWAMVSSIIHLSIYLSSFPSSILPRIGFRLQFKLINGGNLSISCAIWFESISSLRAFLPFLLMMFFVSKCGCYIDWGLW